MLLRLPAAACRFPIARERADAPKSASDRTRPDEDGHCRYRRSSRCGRCGVRHPPPSTASVVDAAGYTWHMVEWGEPADPPLLLVHGVTSSSETFWQVGPTLAAAGRRVIAVDLPGHGRTGRLARPASVHRDRGGPRRLHPGRGAGRRCPCGRRTLVGGDDRRLPARGRLLSGAPDPARPSGATNGRPCDPAEDPTEQRYEDLADAIAAIRASGVSWSEGDIRARRSALTQIDPAAVRAIYLENGDWDAGLAALSDPAARDHPDLDHPGRSAHGGLIADEQFPALAERVGDDHVHHDRRREPLTPAHPSRGDDPGDPRALD